MGTAGLFSTFDRRISADKKQREAASARLFQCVDALTSHYYGSGHTGEAVTIIGSAVKGTALGQIADVDGVFHMPTGTWSRFDTYAGNGQSALLQEVRGVLSARYPRTRIRGDGPVVVVEFTSGADVEVVPGVLFSDGADIVHADCLVPVTRGGGSWETSNYGAEYDKAMRLDSDTDGQYTRLIRYFKAWRRWHDVSFKSVVLELMAAEFVRTWNRSHTSAVYDDWLVRDFLGYMVANYYSTYALPTGKQIDTGVGWVEQAKRSRSDAIAACHVTDSSSAYVTYWRKVLGDAFGA